MKVLVMPKFSCAVSVATECYLTGDQVAPYILHWPLELDGTLNLDIEYASEVTDPQEQEFLNNINTVFGTAFKLSEFAGR